MLQQRSCCVLQIRWQALGRCATKNRKANFTWVAMVLQRQPFFWHIGINRSQFDGTRRWPSSHASRLVWHVTRGVMSPRARAKAVSHANAPASTLSHAALASLLCSEWCEATMAVTASFLVGQHLHERTRPRVERVWLEGAGVGAFRSAACICLCT